MLPWSILGPRNRLPCVVDNSPVIITCRMKSYLCSIVPKPSTVGELFTFQIPEVTFYS